MTKSDKTTCVLISGEAEDLSEILDYLKYSEIDAESTCDEESGICSLTVPADQYEKASALLNIYQEEESEKQKDAAPSDTRTFVGSEEKYRDNASSAWSFLAVGLLVAVLLVLCSAGILPLPLTWSEQPMMLRSARLCGGLCCRRHLFLSKSRTVQKTDERRNFSGI